MMCMTRHQLKNPKGFIDFNKKVFILDPPQNPLLCLYGVSLSRESLYEVRGLWRDHRRALTQVVKLGNEEALAIPHCHHRQFIIIVMMKDPIGQWCQMLH